MSNTERTLYTLPFPPPSPLLPLSSSLLVARGDVPSQVFAQRCEHLIQNPPSSPGDWDAVHDVLSAPKTIAYPKHRNTMQ